MVGLWPFACTWNLRPVEVVFFCRWIFMNFPAPPLAIHRHPSSIAKASYLGRKNVFDPKKKGKKMEGKSSGAAHGIEKQKPGQCKLWKPYYVKVKAGANSSWSFWFITTTRKTPPVGSCASYFDRGPQGMMFMSYQLILISQEVPSDATEQEETSSSKKRSHKYVM